MIATGTTKAPPVATKDMNLAIHTRIETTIEVQIIVDTSTATEIDTTRVLPVELKGMDLPRNTSVQTAIGVQRTLDKNILPPTTTSLSQNTPNPVPPPSTTTSTSTSDSTRIETPRTPHSQKHTKTPAYDTTLTKSCTWTRRRGSIRKSA